MICLLRKFNNLLVFLIVSAVVYPAGFGWAAEPVVGMEAVYVGLTLTGQTPSGGLEPATAVALTAVFSGEANICEGALGYKLFRTIIHAKDGNANNRSASNLEYVARGSGEDLAFDYEFNTGAYGQKNVYWPVFYCWSSDNPAVALGTAQQWSGPLFAQTTVGGACVFSNLRWDISDGADKARMTVKGATLGCRGQSFSFEIWGGSADCRGLANRQIANVEANFSTNGSPPFSAERPWTAPDDKDYCFKIRLPTGVNNCARDPAGNCLWSGALQNAGGDEAGKKGGLGGPVSLEFPNPLAAETVRELVDAILNWIFWLAIPIAVMVILYAGIRMMTAGGDVKRFQDSRKILLWAVVGLAVVFIGEGFIALIESILDLRK